MLAATNRGSMNQQAEEFEQFQKDVSYTEAHHEELLNQYPEQWVAILHQKMVGCARCLPTY